MNPGKGVRKHPAVLLLVGVAFAGVILATLIRFSLRDANPITATIYYASPWLLRLAVALICLAVLGPKARMVSLLLIVVAAIDGSASLQSGPGPESFQPRLRVVTWNAGRELDQHPEHWQFDADVVLIVECGQFDEDEWQRFAASNPRLLWKRLDGGTLLGVEGSFGSVEDLGQHDRFRCHRVQLSLPAFGALQVVTVDIRSQPWLEKQQAIETIFAAANPKQAAIVLGDFNMPPTSRWIEEATGTGWALANRVGTNGLIETWPYRLPLHCLDQIWLSKPLSAIDCRMQTRSSDHRLVCVELVAPAPSP